MHIGIDASRAFITQKTGVEWYAYHLIFQMLQQAYPDIAYTLYTRDDHRSYKEQLPNDFAQLKRLYWPPRYLWTQARLSMEMLLAQPDVLFIPSHTIPAIPAKKTVLTVHDLAFEYFPYLYTKQAYRYHVYSIKKALERAAHIISISQKTKDDLIERYDANPAQITVIHNGYDTASFKPPHDPEKSRQILQKYIKNPIATAEEARYITYIGRIESKKNVASLVRAFESLRHEHLGNLHLILVGKNGFGHEDILEYIYARKLGGNIHLLGWVNEYDLPHIVGASDMFVMPSLYEGFGIPILEAMACGTPVVAAHTGALPEVGGEAALFFDPNDINDIADKMYVLLANDPLREELVAKGFAHAKKFSWEKCGRETQNLLHMIGSQQ